MSAIPRWFLIFAVVMVALTAAMSGIGAGLDYRVTDPPYDIEDSP